MVFFIFLKIFIKNDIFFFKEYVFNLKKFTRRYDNEL